MAVPSSFTVGLPPSCPQVPGLTLDQWGVINDLYISLFSIVQQLNSAAIVGTPAGGLTGQVLTKNSNTDYDVGWAAIPAAPVTSVFGRIGVVVAANGDYTFAQLAGKPTTLAGYGITDSITTTAPITGGGVISGGLTLAVSTFGTANSGVVPASGGGTTNFLRADGAWAAAGGGTGTVTHTAGNLTAGALVVGNAVADIKVSTTMSINANNGLVIAAPTGGVTPGVAITMAANTSGGLTIIGPIAGNSRGVLLSNMGNSAADAAWQSSNVNGIVQFSVFGDGHFVLGSNGASGTPGSLKGDASGNITAPLGTISATGGFSTGAATLMTSTVALTNGAGVGAGTILTAPVAGNPTKWIPVNDNGTTRFIPAW